MIITLTDEIRVALKHVQAIARLHPNYYLVSQIEEQYSCVSVYSTIGLTNYISFTGQFLEDNWDYGIRVLMKQTEINMVLVSACEYIPELRTLLPKRPESAISCYFCEGRGTYSLAQKWGTTNNLQLNCHHCGAIGWVNLDCDCILPTAN